MNALDVKTVSLSPGVSLTASPQGDLYILAPSAAVVPHDKFLYLAKGKFVLGQKAAAAMQQEGHNFLEWNMTASTLVAVNPTLPLPTQLPQGVLPLDTFLVALEAAGFTRVKINKHTCDRAPEETASKFIVKNVEPCALVPASKETGPVTIANLSSFIDFGATKNATHLHVVHRLDFDSKTKTLTAGYPAVFLKKSLRLAAGEVAKIIVAPAPAPAPLAVTVA